MIAKRKTTTKQTWRLAVLLLTAFTWTAESGGNESDNAPAENRTTPTIRIVDQYGRQALSGKRDAGSEIFDVTVGPLENEERQQFHIILRVTIANLETWKPPNAI